MKQGTLGLASRTCLKEAAFSGIRVTLPIDINVGVLTIASDLHVTEAIRKVVHFR
jgi:hypothetical protein